MPAHGRRIAAGTFVLALAASSAQAIAPRGLRRVDEDGLIAMAGVRAPLRRAIRLEFRPMRPAAWTRFVDAAGGDRWTASWDRATAVPSRIWGPGIAVPGGSADPAIAADAARALITAHLDLLAPGADPADLALVANDWDGEMRTIGFVQSRGGMRVIGGQVSVRIKNDRIFVISSQALPDVTVPQPRARVADDLLASRARDALDRALVLPATATAGSPGPAAILPLVGDDGVLGYRVVAPVAIDAGGDGLWTAFVDPGTGDVVARRQELSYVSAGDVRYDVVLRYPGMPRFNAPAGAVALTVDGIDVLSSPTGGIIWGSDADANVVTRVEGVHATVTDESGAPLAVGSIVVPPSGIGIWSVASDEIADAQVNGFIHAKIVQEFARTRFAGRLAFLAEPVQVHVNIADQCNAYSNGTAIHFFKKSPAGASTTCENTALISDVVYHEYGHSIHHHAIIEGVGSFDGAMSEGLSDFLAAAITGDPGMARGFFQTADPLRDIDPPDSENVWPRDIGEIHFTGLIFAGTFWDLRKRMIADLGEEAGVALTLKLFYAAVQRANDIPSSLIEALAADDDDGNLANGTPHECAIRDVFGLHGLRTISGEVFAPGAVVAAAGQTTVPVEILVTGLSSNCPGDEVDLISLAWRPGVGATPPAGGVETTPSGSLWTADLPLPDDGGRVDYQVLIRFTDGNIETLPDNPADRFYQLYQGETVPLYCTDFETDPFAEGWTIGSTSQFQQANFTWGPANSLHSASDPGTAYSGTSILALGLGYDYVDETSVSVNLPPIDVGQYSDVMLQYRRWLGVEDGNFDHALIQANGAPVWSNLDSMMGNSSSTHHIDREWRFHSVGVSTQFAGPILNLEFRLDSDQGLHFGGWQLDDLCVVANPSSICGDGVRSATEQCDLGPANGDDPDTCRANCRLAACGDGVLDSGEECEPGLDPTCLPACIYDAPGAGGCCSAGGGSPTAFLLVGGVGLILLRRRRRRR
jgi:MYXO-CTERM domain-containing protein